VATENVIVDFQVFQFARSDLVFDLTRARFHARGRRTIPNQPGPPCFTAGIKLHNHATIAVKVRLDTSRADLFTGHDIIDGAVSDAAVGRRACRAATQLPW